MADNFSIKCERFFQRNVDYYRYSQWCFTHIKLIVAFFGLILFILTYYLWHSRTLLIPSSKISDTKIYYSSIKRLVPIHKYDSKTMHDKAQGPSTCLIIIRSADGQIGNRMFLFASAYGVARHHQCQLYVAPWILFDLRSVFRINLNETPVHITTDESLVVNRTDIFGRYSSCNFYSDLFQIPLNSTFSRYEMIGFYQSYGYFQHFQEEIKFLFQFNTASVVRSVALVEQLLKVVWNISLNLGNYTKDNVPLSYLKSCLTHPPPPSIPVTWIGIHIRRGDFLSFFRIDTSLAYLNWAMNYYRRKYVNCRFLIASDDKAYVQKNFGNNSDVFVTPNGFFSGEDLAALTLCEHTIVTAGTYGWWAGWLAGGDVIHDLNYPVPFQNCKREHYFPPWFLFPHNSSSLAWPPTSPKTA